MIEQTLRRIEQGDFFLLAGPCAVEDEHVCLQIAQTMAELCQKHDIPYVFKASYKKANRLSHGSFATIGVEEALRILAKVKTELNLPIITDVHETTEIKPVAQVADILQIPAFLCRQTDLVVQAAATGKWVNIKKGQFLAPDDMAKIAAKARSDRVMLTERGTSFGYHSLVVDFRSLLIMAESGYPVVYDATHSLQLPGGGGRVSTGQPEYVVPMARAAMAVGVNGLFVETHPDPAQARSDAGAMLPLEQMSSLLDQIMIIRTARKEAQS
ncbi:3-deoxy-8-phosphooctulonate synthase [candidate division GN15 bacterium]|nr:3-deoxy-8-phosphooctulonate synthase [candidate division GN15 bacterium]